MFTSLTIRSRLLLLVAVCILPMYGIVSYNAWSSGQQTKQKALTQLQIDAQATAANIDQVIRSTASLLYTFKNISQLRDIYGTAPCEMLKSLLSIDSRYKNGYIVQPDGLIQCFSEPTAARGNISDYGYFRRAMASGKVEVGFPRVCPNTDGYCFPLALALHNASGQVVSVLALDLDPVWLAERTAIAWSKTQTLMFWWDGETRVAFAWPETENWVGKFLTDNKVGINMLGKSAGHFIEEGFDGKNKLFGYSTIRGIGAPDMKLSLGVPQNVLSAPIQVILLRNLALVTMIAMISLILAWMFSDFILNRLEALSQMVKRTGIKSRRNSTNKIYTGIDKRRRHMEESYSNDVFGRLAYEITNMAERYVAAARSRNSKLRAIIERFSKEVTFYKLDSNLFFSNTTDGNNYNWSKTSVAQLPEGVMFFDLEGQLLYCNQAALDLYELTSVDLFRRSHQSGLTSVFDLASLDGILWPVEQWPLSILLRGESLYDMNTNIQNKHEGWQKNINYSGTLINDNNEKPIMAVLIMREITEHKRPMKPNRVISEFG